MHSIKQSLAQTVSLKLQELIQQGYWQEKLPGIRALCDELQVSKQTMMLALRLLEKAGYVTATEKGKGRRIISEAEISASHPTAQEKHTVSIISSTTEAKLATIDALIVSNLKNLLIASGYTCRYVVFEDLLLQEGQEKIVEVISDHPSSAYILMAPHKLSMEKLSPLKLPIIYLGGQHVDGCFPRVLFSLIDMFDAALAHLKSIGHKQITCMLSPLFISTDKTISPELKAQFKQSYLRNKLVYDEFSCPAWGKTTDDFMDCLEDVFSQTSPTAIIVTDSESIPRVISFLMHKNLKYPDDVSLVALDENPVLGEYNPPISSVNKSAATFSRHVLQAVNKLLTAPEEVEQKKTLSPVKLKMTASVRLITTS